MIISLAPAKKSLFEKFHYSFILLQAAAASQYHIGTSLQPTAAYQYHIGTSLQAAAAFQYHIGLTLQAAALNQYLYMLLPGNKLTIKTLWLIAFLKALFISDFLRC